MLCNFNCPAVNHRMYVLQGSTADPWTSNYTMKAQLNTYDQFAIDGTYFQHTTGLYHVYSCWYSAYESWPSNLCITKMSNPWTVESNVTERQILSVPTQPWERTPYGRMQNDRLSSNEGPEQLTSPDGKQFIIYSAARSDNRNYCLGQLELVGEDPMNNQDWRKNNENCVFYQNALQHAYGVGHASRSFHTHCSVEIADMLCRLYHLAGRHRELHCLPWHGGPLLRLECAEHSDTEIHLER